MVALVAGVGGMAGSDVGGNQLLVRSAIGVEG